MKKPICLTKLLRDTRGAAMVEGVIVLPIFVLTLAGLIYFHHLYAAKLETNRQARACAWEYSVNGCDPDLLPKGCHATKLGDEFKPVGATMQGGNPFDVQTSGSSSQKQEQAKNGLDKGLEGASSVGLALIGLNEGQTTSYSKDVIRPSLLGGGKERVTSFYSVMCNEKDMDPIDIAKAALCALAETMSFKAC